MYKDILHWTNVSLMKCLLWAQENLVQRFDKANCKRSHVVDEDWWRLMKIHLKIMFLLY